MKKREEFFTPKGVIVKEVANLRRDRDDKEVWRRAGKPRKVFGLGVLPFLRFAPYGGDEIELSTDGKGGLYGRIIAQGAQTGNLLAGDGPKLLAQMKGEPILAVTGARGIIRLLLKHAPDCFLTYDEELRLTFCGEMPDLPTIRLGAEDGTTFYSPLGTIALTGGSSGTSGSQLCDADVAKVKTAMLNAYRDVREQATRYGRFVQPITARYRLLDAAGNTVAVGEKTPLGHSAGGSATDKVVLTSTDLMQTLSGGSLAARSYSPVVVAPDRLPYPWNRIVDRLVIEITDEMEPVDSAARLAHGVQRNAQSGQVSVTAQLPGLAIERESIEARYAALALEQLKGPYYQTYGFDDPYGVGLVFNGKVLEPGEEMLLGLTTPHNYPQAPESERIQRLRSYSAALDAGEFTLLCNPKEEEGEVGAGEAEIVRSDDLGAVLCRQRVMHGEIVAVKPLPRSGTGWDFSRVKVLMFGAEGTKLTTLNGKGEVHSVTTIDHRGIDSAAAVCEATGGNGATLLALAGGDIVEISGQKVTTRYARLPEGSGIGWCERFKEIWIAGSDRLWRLTEDNELICAELPGINGIDYQPPYRLGQSSGELLLATSREQRNLSDEEADGLLDIRLRLRYRNPLPAGTRDSWLTLNTFGSGLLGSFRLRGDRGTEIAEELLKVVITGDVNAPITLRMWSPYRGWLEEDYRFAANADLAILSTTIGASLPKPTRGEEKNR